MFSNLTIKINYGISHTLASEVSRDTLKAYALFYKLKSMAYVGGSIHDFEKRKRLIANKLGIHLNTFKKRLGILRANGDVWVEGGCLRLISKERLSKRLKPASSKGKYKLSGSLSLTELKDRISIISIKENLKRQAFCFNEKRVNKRVAQAYGEIHSEKIRKKVAKTERRKLKEASFRVPRNPMSPVEQEVNANITLSRKGIAQRFGCRSASTGSRRMKWLNAEGWTKDEKNIVFCGSISPAQTKAWKQNLSLLGPFFIFNNKFFRRYCNTISIIKDIS